MHHPSPWFQIFRIVSHLLELLDASVNFYIYYFCNREVRARVHEMIGSLREQAWPSRRRCREMVAAEEEKDEDSSAKELRRMFPSVFQPAEQ